MSPVVMGSGMGEAMSKKASIVTKKTRVGAGGFNNEGRKVARLSCGRVRWWFTDLLRVFIRQQGTPRSNWLSYLFTSQSRSGHPGTLVVADNPTTHPLAFQKISSRYEDPREWVLFIPATTIKARSDMACPVHTAARRFHFDIGGGRPRQ